MLSDLRETQSLQSHADVVTIGARGRAEPVARGAHREAASDGRAHAEHIEHRTAKIGNDQPGDDYDRGGERGVGGRV